MELRRLSILAAFFVLAVVSTCSEARHSLQRRSPDYGDIQNDAAADYDTQNDDGSNDPDDEVMSKPGIIVTKPDNYRLLIGRSVRLECKVDPPEGLVISWSKSTDGRDEEKIFFGSINMKQHEKYALISTDLVVKDLTTSDTGRYTCQIEQKDKVNITHVVIVEEPPMVTNEATTSTDDNDIDNFEPRIVSFTASDNGHVREGSNLLLTCVVSGTPKPSIIWSRYRREGFGTESLTASIGEFSENTFFMKNISRSDSGTYYCYAVSDAGNATSSLDVTVSGKPRIRVHKPVINTDIGVEAILQCSTRDEPEVHHIRWLKDGQLVENAVTTYSVNTTQEDSKTVSTLTVTPTSDREFGVFTCEATNFHGSHSKSIELVQRPVVEGVSADGPKLTWNVHSHQPLEEITVHLRQLAQDGNWTSYKVPLPDRSAKKHEYEMIYVLDDSKLQEGSYEATIDVKNDKAWSEHSNPVILNIERLAQPIQKASITLQAGNEIGDAIDEEIDDDDDDDDDFENSNSTDSTNSTGRIVFGGSTSSSMRQSTCVFATVLMCLLVRLM